MKRKIDSPETKGNGHDVLPEGTIVHGLALVNGRAESVEVQIDRFNAHVPPRELLAVCAQTKKLTGGIVKLVHMDAPILPKKGVLSWFDL